MKQLKQYITENHLKYHVITYGCQMNEHESEKICGILEDLGFVSEAEKTKADFVIFNTCCVRENAEKKTFGNVGALRPLKKENPNLMIAVCGCMMQQEKVAQKLVKTFPFVDIVFGTHNLHTLGDLVGECLMEKKRVFSIQEKADGIHEDVPMRRGEGSLASVNIMYGCNNFCSYCIVPYVRGRERSRRIADIIREVQKLQNAGYKEVMLLGQNVNSYDGGEGDDFSVLLQKICDETEIPRIRFMTSHPKDLSDRLIATIAANERICRHIHLPVQSGSTKILQAMNRKYTREQYTALVSRIRAQIPDVALTTDIIVGFPGETDLDFEATLSLVREIRYDSAFTFVYSRRTGTKAAQMANPVPEEVQKKRIIQLVALQNEITQQRNQEYEGNVETVLVEGVSTRNPAHVCGRTGTSKMVNFEGSSDLIGTFCDVLITQGKKTTLFGERIINP
ncbi:MAG: tRNA (N6-isopentenyl adenosine(37)-C2)-methylthiotransferase MiaB [Christensenella sp.]|nr:tRNA (N6-isopentenyl adenosine(37)-C2)-methylthiotransferase MiaB [Christensenella sp.]